MESPFEVVESDVWIPDSNDYKTNSAGHAMVVVGYNDSLYGGAFELMNSWGTNWGNEGFIWIRYKDFDHFCHFGFELIDKTIIQNENFELSGSLIFIDKKNDDIEVVLEDGMLKSQESYKSETRFQVLMSNQNPIFIYAFGTDRKNNGSMLFPFEDRMLAYFPYTNSNIALPSEDSFYALDSTIGKSYFIFLYSLEKLNADKFLEFLDKSELSVEKSINLYFNQKIIDYENIAYDLSSGINFAANSKNGSILPIIVEIDHVK